MAVRESTKCKVNAKDVLALLMIVIVIVGILFVLLGFYGWWVFQKQPHTSCSTYQDCTAAGLHEFDCESNHCVPHKNGLKSQTTTHHDPPHVTFQNRSYIVAVSLGAAAVLLVVAIYAAFVCISEWKHYKNSSDNCHTDQLITV